MENNFSAEETRWRIIKFKVLEQRIEEIFHLFREQGIEPILIKGWAISLKYPKQYMRFFSDIDLAVAPEIYDKVPGKLEGNHTGIDLHKGLRHLDNLDWEILYSNSRTEKIGLTDIRILSEEDHLRVLCIHWLTDGGAYKEKLWDIFYAVENRSQNFDWKKCLDNIGSKRRLWVIYTILLAHKYLNLDVSNLPFRREIEGLPEWIIKTVEKEWKSPVKLRPIHTCLNDRQEVLRQIWKRIPPNPIQATIEMEGDFDDKSRIPFQVRSILNRIKPSAKRVFGKIRKKSE